MYTVFGASGHTGRIVTERLIAAGKQVRAVVRDAARAPRGSEPFVGSLTEPGFASRALAGAEGAYFVVPPDVKARDLLAQNRAIAEAYAEGIRAQRLPHGVVLSSLGAQHESGIGPATSNAHAERILGPTGAALTFLRPPFFMENLAGNVVPMKRDGVLPVFGGGEQFPFPMIATRDIGAAAADALLAPARTSRAVEMRGPRDYSYADVAAAASEILGTRVTATPLPIDAMVPALVQHGGFSPEVAALFREMIDAGKAGRFAYTDAAHAITGATPLETVLRAIL
ncbi:MAG TPA: NmrA family NAD(P)-binding protein [Kofleriaceae bacterium]